VNAGDRILLLDVENLGMVRMRPHLLRARLEAILAAAGEIHHAVASYSLPDGAEDPLASLLAELRIAPLPVPPGANAAELALLAHAQHVHTAGGRIFIVGSADGRFAQLAELGRVELIVWDGQPVATRLAEVAYHLRRVARRTVTPADNATGQEEPEPEGVSAVTATAGRPCHSELAVRLLGALVTGAGIALGTAIIDRLLRRRHRP
jgi:hypothetical protein